MPGNDVVEAGSDEQAPCGCVGAVDEYLVVDAMGVWGVGYVNEPEVGESAGQCPVADVSLGSQSGQ